jgi:hypothetical protein
MSIDAKKLKKILSRNNILPLEYFCFKGEGKCAMVKCAMFSISQMMLLYIPSKYRFSVSDQSNVYDVEDLDEDHTEDDDYSKRDDASYADQKLQDEHNTKYELMHAKYQFPVTLQGTEEPTVRKLKRQLNRLNAPLAKTSYNLAIQQDRFLYVSFGDDNVGSYYIRGYQIPREMTRSCMYVTSITDIIEKIEEINSEISIISEKFVSMVMRLSESNLSEMSAEIENVPNVVSRLRARRDECMKSLREAGEWFERVKREEDDLTERFRQETMQAKTSHDRSRVGEAIQKEIDALFDKKNEQIRKNINTLYRYHKIVLFLEEISFDNSVMLDRVKKNFQLLKTLTTS